MSAIPTVLLLEYVNLAIPTFKHTASADLDTRATANAVALIELNVRHKGSGF
jgi:hypothetical protein